MKGGRKGEREEGRVRGEELRGGRRKRRGPLTF